MGKLQEALRSGCDRIQRLWRFLWWLLDPTSYPGAQVWVCLIISVFYRAALHGLRFMALPKELFTDFAIVSTVNAIVLFGRFIRLRRALAVILDIFSFSHPSVRPGYVEYTVTRLNEARSTLEGLGGEGSEYEKSKVDDIARAFFLETDAQYDGVDTHAPTMYMESFDTYLEAHATAIGRWRKRGTRVLAVDGEGLAIDYRLNSQAFDRFLKWHDDQGVRLKRIDMSQARALLKAPLATLDIGVWRDKLALHFTEAQEEQGLKRRLALQAVGSKGYEASARYVQAVIDRAEPLKKADVIAAAEHIAHSDFADIARRWEEYVNCSERLRHLGEFLKTTLTDYKANRVLDAATGIGCESVFLIKEGFDVISNEIDINLLREAERISKDAGVALTMRTFNWFEIADSYKVRHAAGGRGGLFDAVLVLGNSLSMLLREEDIGKALSQFFELLSPNGILIVDQRNFQHMLSHPEVIDDPSRFGKVMYCGTSIRGLPTQVWEDRLIRFDLVEMTARGRRGKTLKSFLLYPFKENELQRMLREVGFSDVDTYYDFSDRVNPEAEFLTHVAFKK